MINRVVLTGRLTRDPELRTTTSGKNVCEFSIAVDRRFKGPEGSQTADFFRIKAWSQTAEFVAQYLNKGRLIAVDGRLETRKYQTNDGQNREVTEIVADNVYALDRPRDDAQNGGQRAAATVTAGDDEYDPFAEE